MSKMKKYEIKYLDFFVCDGNAANTKFLIIE